MVAAAAPAPVPATLLTPREAAKRLRVSGTTLWRLTQRGQIPAVRISDRIVRYDSTHVESFIQSQCS